MPFRELATAQNDATLFPALSSEGSAGLWGVLIRDNSPVMKLWFLAMAVQIICLAVLFS